MNKVPQRKPSTQNPLLPSCVLIGLSAAEQSLFVSLFIYFFFTPVAADTFCHPLNDHYNCNTFAHTCTKTWLLTMQHIE